MEMNLRQAIALIAALVGIGIAIELASVVFWKAVRYPYDLKGTAQVIDGDTLFVDARDVRLFGIDAPERRQICTKNSKPWPAGQAATDWLRDKINGQVVGCNFETHDTYVRIIATCYLNGEDISAASVYAGWAWAYRRFSARYVPQERLAKEFQKGIWIGDCSPPWEYRRLN